MKSVKNKIEQAMSGTVFLQRKTVSGTVYFYKVKNDSFADTVPSNPLAKKWWEIRREIHLKISEPFLERPQVQIYNKMRSEVYGR